MASMFHRHDEEREISKWRGREVISDRFSYEEERLLHLSCMCIWTCM